MMTHPGKKLNFMGNELAMFNFSDREAEMPPCSGKLLLHTDWRCFGGQTDEPGTKLPPFSGVLVVCEN